jgi:hypothetical protein
VVSLRFPQWYGVGVAGKAVGVAEMTAAGVADGTAVGTAVMIGVSVGVAVGVGDTFMLPVVQPDTVIAHSNNADITNIAVTFIDPMILPSERDTPVRPSVAGRFSVAPAPGLFRQVNCPLVKSFSSGRQCNFLPAPAKRCGRGFVSIVLISREIWRG